jgi:FlaA1/EpsC-like NDP-sugar epimerase
MDKYSFDQALYNATTMKRIYKRLIMTVADSIALPLALWSGFALRLSEWWPKDDLAASFWLFVILPFTGVYVFMRLGLYRAVVRFMGTQAILAVVKGVMLLALLLWAAATVLNLSPFPRSVPVIFALVALVYVGGSRLLIRHYYHWLITGHLNKDAVLIYGAGGAGIQLATALTGGGEYYPVGFIDDDKTLWKSTIKGLPVHNPKLVGSVIKYSSVKHVLLAVPSITNKQRGQMVDRLGKHNVHVKTIPSMPEILSGKASIEQLREVQIEDLLNRDSVPPMDSLLKKCIDGKVVLVTGAGGSIGSEICKQVIKHKPNKLILFELSEYNLYQVEQDLQKIIAENSYNVEIVSLLGSVCDRKILKRVFSSFAIGTVYHAAAYKHVPLVEHNIMQGVSNNIFGTQILAEEAAKVEVDHFILISTDKAVRPTNVMGATKRFSELILQNLSHLPGNTIFSMVRFGNVLGSSGSVVPLFRKQIASGGPVTVTHKDITRYFMTIPEAASLVIQAGSMAVGGDVFVLDMGEPVKIIDLARRLIHLSGLEVKDEVNIDGDISIECTGLRPAEKLYEELLVSDDVVGTGHPKIMKANEDGLSNEQVSSFLIAIKNACDEENCSKLVDTLQQAVAGYQPHDSIVDYLYICPDKESNIINIF